MSRIRKRAALLARVFPSYHAFDPDNHPAWWGSREMEERWGEVLGIYEHKPHSPEDAMLITENGIGVFEKDRGSRWFPYSDIVGWEPLSKEPISETLVIKLRSGAREVLRFRPGEPFQFVPFLISVRRILGAAK